MEDLNSLNRGPPSAGRRMEENIFSRSVKMQFFLDKSGISLKTALKEYSENDVFRAVRNNRKKTFGNLEHENRESIFDNKKTAIWPVEIAIHSNFLALWAEWSQTNEG